MKFTSIPGLLREKSRLQALFAKNRIPHALLFTGGEGSGKLALALAFSSLIQCKNPIDNEACGECDQCNKTFKLIHPDIHFFFPLSGGKEVSSLEYVGEWRNAVLSNPYLNSTFWQEKIEIENKLLNITATECRLMVSQLSMTIYEGHKRILFVWLPEYLGKEGNILLKLIEEPPANSIILLVSENPSALLPTIQSRCQTLPISPFIDEDIRHQLQDRGAKDEKLIRNILSSAEGNLFLAIKMLEDQVNPQVEKMMQWLRLCLKNNAKGIQDWCENIANEGRDGQRQFLVFGLSLLEHILTYKVSQQEFPAYNPEDWKSIKGLANLLEYSDIEILETLFTDHISFVERNAHAKILFTALSINISQVLNKKKVEMMEMM